MLPWKICYRDTRTHCLGNKEHLASDQGPSYSRLINALLVKLPDSRWTFIINDHRVHFNFRLLKPQECKTLFPGNIQTVMSFCSSSNTTAKYRPNTKKNRQQNICSASKPTELDMLDNAFQDVLFWPNSIAINTIL